MLAVTSGSILKINKTKIKSDVLNNLHEIFIVATSYYSSHFLKVSAFKLHLICRYEGYMINRSVSQRPLSHKNSIYVKPES
jgi:hypothetical protein